MCPLQDKIATLHLQMFPYKLHDIFIYKKVVRVRVIIQNANNN